MANFKAVVRTKKEYNTVYIRITHKAGKVDYIVSDRKHLFFQKLPEKLFWGVLIFESTFTK